jgi:hypothetical protein
MSEKEYNKLLQLANRKVKERTSKAEALIVLKAAGIITQTGRLKAAYKTPLKKTPTT